MILMSWRAHGISILAMAHGNITMGRKPKENQTRCEQMIRGKYQAPNSHPFIWELA